MTRRPVSRSIVALLVAGGGFLATGVSPIAAADHSSRSAVAEVLRTEAEGAIDRSAALAPVLETDPDNESARWQSGFVRTDDGWTPFDAAADESPRRTKLLAEYRVRREFAQPTAESQLELADWCVTHGLRDRERAHLTAVLLAAGDRPLPGIRARLGQTWVAGAWRTSEEVAALQHETDRLAREDRLWRTRIERIRKGLSSDRPRTVELAVDQLREIDDPTAVPAIHRLLGTAGEEQARRAIGYIARFATVDATRALAFHAAFSPWESVRKKATKCVASRNPRHFVPELLSATHTPYRTRYELLAGPANTAVFRQVFGREGRTAREFDIFDFGEEVHLTPYVQRDVEISLRLRIVAEEGRRGTADVVREEARRRELRRVEMERADARTRAINEQVAVVLRRFSERELGDDPEDLWQWWNEYTDVESPTAKVLTIRVNLAIRPNQRFQQVRDPAIQTSSCLVAGTPVWTDEGPRAVESIAVGDLVLAKDPRTGRLVHQPVLQTTVRVPRPLVTFRVGAEEEPIVCTGGHEFWVSGRGWTMARDLKPNDRLHDATGTTPVVSEVTPADEQPTYNLVVADFHTYFVGHAPILSHDVTPSQPTDRVVPGEF